MENPLCFQCVVRDLNPALEPNLSSLASYRESKKLKSKIFIITLRLNSNLKFCDQLSHTKKNKIFYFFSPLFVIKGAFELGKEKPSPPSDAGTRESHVRNEHEKNGRTIRP